MQCNVKFGHQMCICSRTEINHDLIDLARRRIAWRMLSNAKIPLNYSSRFSPYSAVNTHRLGYKTQSVDAV